MSEELYTAKQAHTLLKRRVREAGSQYALAGRNPGVQSAISAVLKGNRPISNPRVLDALGLEVVFRPKRKRLKQPA